jgi:hypothetical protein
MPIQRSFFPSSSRLVAAALMLAACSGGASPPLTAAPGSATEAAPQPVEAAPDSAAPAGKRAPCTLGADQSCNDDPTVSALWGRCTELGVCECKPGFERSPTTDLCRPVR